MSSRKSRPCVLKIRLHIPGAATPPNFHLIQSHRDTWTLTGRRVRYRTVHISLCPKYIIERCSECHVICSYNINSGEGKIVYNKCGPLVMCEGPDETLLVMDHEQNLLQLKWNKKKERITTC